MIKIANVDIQAKEHNFASPEDYFEKRRLSPGIMSAVAINNMSGFRVCILQIARKIRSPGKIDLNGLEVFLFPGSPRWYLNKKDLNYRLYSKELEGMLLEGGWDAVHLNQSSGNNLFRLCGVLAKRGIPYIIHFRGGDLESFTPQRKSTFGKASAVILNNEDQKKRLLEVLPGMKGKINLIPQGIDPVLFKEGTSRKENMLSFGYAGRIYPHKGIIRAIEFIAFLRSLGYKVSFALAGNFEERSFESEAKKLIRELRIEDAVHFTGYLSTEEIVPFYQNIGYLLFLSEHESFGKSVAEAMSCGAVPIIRTNSSGPEEIIGKGAFGYYLPCEERWADFAGTLFNETAYFSMREKAVRRAAYYSFGNYTDAISALYREVAAAGSGGKKREVTDP